jgi:hypothetical protein
VSLTRWPKPICLDFNLRIDFDNRFGADRARGQRAITRQRAIRGACQA